MDLPYAVERCREPLLRNVAMLYAMIGLADGGSIERLSWPLYRAVLALLRPAESAVRRLIVAAAQGLVVKPRTSCAKSAGRVIAGKGKRRLRFRLFDLLPRANGFRRPRPKTPVPEPRIHSF